ncbi:MAG TPA: protein-export chaperone SecB [Gammaproteobacteria bacterium]|nr:protein-export chaperone SecB [Gammaproteobacteria bacterium]
MADEQTGPQRLVLIGRVYLKNLSFKSPKVPDVFTADRNAETLLNLRSTNAQIDAEHVEVLLHVNVKTVNGEDTLFQIEIVQAGVFRMTGYTPEEMLELLGRVCPETLFPFARKTIDDVARRGGFPEVSLRPLDFDALFAEHMRKHAGEVPAT